jgi:hypothetical protein
MGSNNESDSNLFGLSLNSVELSFKICRIMNSLLRQYPIPMVLQAQLVHLSNKHVDPVHYPSRHNSVSSTPLCVVFAP